MLFGSKKAMLPSSRFPSKGGGGESDLAVRREGSSAKIFKAVYRSERMSEATCLRGIPDEKL